MAKCAERCSKVTGANTANFLLTHSVGPSLFSLSLSLSSETPEHRNLEKVAQRGTTTTAVDCWEPPHTASEPTLWAASADCRTSESVKPVKLPVCVYEQEESESEHKAMQLAFYSF